MATIKSFTDIEQSKKLAEILPIESADMFLAINGTIPMVSKYFDEGYVTADNTAVPCWSLASLLGVLPNDTSLLYFDDAYQMVYDKKPYVISDKFDNPVDACVAIIEKLKELNLL